MAMSSAPPTSPFLFITCQPGAEKFVKADVARQHPHLRLAFSRPGFITFKWPDGGFSPDVERPTPLARCWGPAFGSAAKGPHAVEEAVGRLKELLGPNPVIHAFTRDAVPLGEEPEDHDPWAADARLAARVAAVEPRWPVNRLPAQGQRVLDVIEVDPDEVWVGVHTHGGEHRPTPGGRPPRRETPADAPSRVWHKIEEAIWWTHASPGPGDVVLDIGCAPGGGTLALLNRGARVIGVDPGEMRPAVLSHPAFEHRAMAFEQLQPGSLPRGVNWLVYDVNLSPMLTLGALRRLLTRLPDIRSGFLTLKLNKLEHLEKLDWMLQQLRSAGFTRLRVTQLFYNRQELFIFAQR